MVLELPLPTMASSSFASSTVAIHSQTRAFTMVIPANLALLSLQLNQSNYAIWKSQVLLTVRAHELESFLLGTCSRPDAFIPDLDNPNLSINNPEHTIWIRLDHLMMSWLFSSIFETMLGHVVHCYTTVDIWRMLEQLFSTKSKARILQLYLPLQTTKKLYSY